MWFFFSILLGIFFFEYYIYGFEILNLGLLERSNNAWTTKLCPYWLFSTSIYSVRMTLCRMRLASDLDKKRWGEYAFIMRSNFSLCFMILLININLYGESSTIVNLAKSFLHGSLNKWNFFFFWNQTIIFPSKVIKQIHHSYRWRVIVWGRSDNWTWDQKTCYLIRKGWSSRNQWTFKRSSL